MKTKTIFLGIFLFFGFHFGHAQCVISAGNNQSITCGDSVTLNPTTSWNSISYTPLIGYSLKSTYFINNDIGYIIGDNVNSAVLSKTTDGGLTWTSQTSSAPGVSISLNKIHFFNDTLGFFVGSATYMGMTIEMISIIQGDSVYSGSFGDNPLNRNLNDVYFVSTTVGYVVGSFGTIGKSTNGGYDWNALNSGILHTLYGIYFTSPAIGYAVGASGTILKTTDAGLTWIPKTSNTSETLRDVHFINSNTGFAVGDNGVILKTLDAGENWILQTSGTVNHLKSIDFAPNGLGYIAGQNTILTTTDGTNWSNDYNTSITLSGINLSSNNVGYSVGEQGEIVKKVLFEEYIWSPSTGLNDPNIQTPIASPAQTTTYTVTASYLNGCTATSSITISVIPMNAPEICMVSVSENNKNRVVWEKPETDLVDSFYIYRETNISDIYQLIGTIPYSIITIFEDLSSNPTIQSNRYKISMKDVCGLESNKSESHKTMHLTINQGVGTTYNLIWEPYFGFDVTTYNIYRGTSASNLALIGSTSGGSSQYTDLNAPTGTQYYQVEVVSPTPCNPTKTITSSRSNIVSTDEVGINHYSFSDLSDIHIFPNPASNFFTIDSKTNVNIKDVTIFDQQGKLILNVQSDYSKIDLSYIQSGLYIIKITTENQIIFQKLIINK